jgi:hypothetical protein
MLLSFAQFERELGSERVRDKIAASKAKGMWTGGAVPFGYEVRARRLEICPYEAEQVRFIFERYATLKSVRKLIDSLAEHGFVTRKTLLRTGKARGGIPFKQGCLYHLLRNETYLGLTRHKERTYPGQHQAIIEPELWGRVQATLKENSVDRKCAAGAKVPSILAGIIWDSAGRRMSPSHTQKPSKRYRYYVSAEDLYGEVGATNVALMRVPAENLEKLVCAKLRRHFADSGGWLNIWKNEGLSAEEIFHRLKRVRALSRDLAQKNRSTLRKLLLAICQSVTVAEKHISVRISEVGAGELLGFCASARSQEIIIPCKMRKSVPNACLILLPNNRGITATDRSLLGLLGKAHAAKELLETGDDQAPLDAERRRYLVKLAKFTFLAPDIVRAILNGQQPDHMTAEKLRRISRLPPSWCDQQKLLGFLPWASEEGLKSS